ncbi:MAG: glutathione S-transferase [Comamonadaceae bacterium]|nr:MAG: glutathione S-transferase [Comamonadaceae bacterium]
MAAPALPVLYSFRRCPYAMRARLALAASGEHCELREVRLRDKPAEMLAASPKGTVPVLVMADGTVIDQSLDIMLWALRRHDPLRWLAPSNESLEASLALIAECESQFKPQLDRYKYPNRFAPIDHAPGARERCVVFVDSLEHRLAQNGHLAGTHASIADAAVMPFIRQFAMVEPAWFSACPWPRLQAWLSSWTASSLFAQIMRKE